MTGTERPLVEWGLAVALGVVCGLASAAVVTWAAARWGWI